MNSVSQVAAAQCAGAQHGNARHVRLRLGVLQGVADDGRARGLFRLDVRHQALAHRVVQVDHGVLQARPVEQDGLGGFVIRFVAVVVQVVARQVGEDRHVEMHAVEAALVQADGGRFDGQRHGAVGMHLLQLACQQHRVRRGVAGFVELHFATGAEHAHAQRADHGGGFADFGQGLAGPHRAGSLAVGAGNGHGEHAGVGLAVPGVRDRAGLFFSGQARPGAVQRGRHPRRKRCRHTPRRQRHSRWQWR